MKKAELKETLKPLIKQCIKEVLFEDGVLSGIISEVVKGFGKQPPMIESAKVLPVDDAGESAEKQRRLAELRESHLQEVQEQRSKLNEAVASRFGGADLFEGTAPLAKAGNVGQPTAPASPLQGVDPSDPGVDLSKLGIFGQ